MKQFLFLFTALLMFNANVFSQNMVKLNINHQLGSVPFALNTGAQNNLGDDFNISRLEYYLSQFTVVHDGGIETEINNVYALVDASAATVIDLGNHNITSVEAIRFYIGVDSATNHLDPASYDATHPLAPKSPSMHWGWSSGYRFVALEGKGSSNYNQDIELHGLGNNNYFQTEISSTATASNNEVIIDVYADYAFALSNISVNGGAFEHGFSGDALKVLSNFNKLVFKQHPTSIIDFSEIKDFSVFPNPTTGATNILIEATENSDYQVLITDVLGKKIELITNLKSNQPISTQLEQAGLYFVQLVKDGQTVITKKLLVQ